MQYKPKRSIYIQQGATSRSRGTRFMDAVGLNSQSCLYITRRILVTGYELVTLGPLQKCFGTQ